MHDYNLGTRAAEGEMWSSGIGYVHIPTDVDREKYIGECFRSSSVSLFTEHNGYFNRVPIDRFSLSFIDFPNKTNENGSAVSYHVDPVHKRPIITGIHFTNDELADLVEHQFKFKRILGNNQVEITGSPKEKYIALNVNADKEGNLSLNVNSHDDSGSINLNVEGTTQITSTQNTIVKQHSSYVLKTVNKQDEKKYSLFVQTPEENNLSGDVTNIDSPNTNINTDKLRINNGEEPIILGKKWASFMKDLIKEIGQSTVSTTIGQQPLLNATKIIEYQNKVDDLLSKIGFIDS